MKFSHYLIWFSVFIIFFSANKKDNAELIKDIQKINNNFFDNKHVSFKISYLLFENYTSTKVFEQKEGFYLRNDNEHLTNIDGFLYVYLKDMLLVVDSSSKTILIGNPVKFDAKSLNLFPISGKTNYYSKIDVISDNEKSKTVKFNIASNIVSPTNSVMITYNKSNFFVNKIVLYFREKVTLDDKAKTKTQLRLEIILNNYVNDKNLSFQSISASQYIQKSNQSYIGIGKYKNYKVLDQRYKK